MSSLARNIMDDKIARAVGNDAGVLTRRFNAIVVRAQAALFWERLWPRLAPAFVAGGIFLTAAWSGALGKLPPREREAAFLITLAAAAGSPFLMRAKSLLVHRREAIDRIDRNLNLDESKQQPARMMGGQPAQNSAPRTVALWTLNLQRNWAQWGDKFSAGFPRPHTPKINILFATAALSATAAFLIAGDQAGRRLAQALDWKIPPPALAPPPAPPPLQIRAWVTPPDNMGLTPLYLTESNHDNVPAGKTLSVHRQSVLTIETIGKEPLIDKHGNYIAAKKLEPARAGAKKPPVYQYQIPLPQEEDCTVSVQNGPHWNFHVEPDEPPSVIIESIVTKDGKSMLVFRTKDDYGVKQAEAHIKAANDDPQARPLSSGDIPTIILPVPRQATPAP